MIWWAEQPNRAQSERAAVSDLADRNTWLVGVKWRLIANLKIVADFELQVCGRNIPLILAYPEFFPDAAPSITPQDGLRLSGHQYGASGELCLQYRPDNWTPEITGAMMIESAYRLLTSEQETGEPALTEHRTVPAQHARNSVLRFLCSQDVLTGLLMVDVGTVVDAEVQEHFFAGVWSAQLSRIGPTDQPIWVEPNKRGYGATELTSKVVRLSEGTPLQYDTLESLVALLEHNGFGALTSELLQVPSSIGVIISDGVSVRAPMVYGDVDARKLIEYKILYTETESPRLDPGYTRLKEASVAIVGCGSVGSKVAVHLARSGVGKFVLVDGDVLASGNLVRNELDWRAVGLHKSQALAARLQEVRSDCEVLSRTTVLGGQESGESTAATMRVIAGCDLIVDATADPGVYNLCASIARRAKKPMCWAQVYGGGAGGIVVRVRPSTDPTPLVVRQRIEAWYSDQRVAWPRDGTSQLYAGVDDVGEPLIADDCEVSVIAGHLARFVVDLISRPNHSIFPYSAYVIGMSRQWIFSEPFDVHPIDVGAADAWDTEVQEGDSESLRQFITDLLPGTSDEN